MIQKRKFIYSGVGTNKNSKTIKTVLPTCWLLPTYPSSTTTASLQHPCGLKTSIQFNCHYKFIIYKHIFSETGLIQMKVNVPASVLIKSSSCQETGFTQSRCNSNLFVFRWLDEQTYCNFAFYSLNIYYVKH